MISFQNINTFGLQQLKCKTTGIILLDSLDQKYNTMKLTTVMMNQMKEFGNSILKSCTILHW